MARMKRASSGYKSTSSAASSFSRAQKRSYAAMNRSNSARIATNRARNAAMGYTNGSTRSSGTRSPSLPRVTPQWQLFGGIGDAIRRAVGGR